MEENRMVCRSERSFVRLTQVGEAVVESKDSENGQVLLRGEGEAIGGEEQVEDQQRNEEEYDEVSEDHLGTKFKEVNWFGFTAIA